MMTFGRLLYLLSIPNVALAASEFGCSFHSSQIQHHQFPGKEFAFIFLPPIFLPNSLNGWQKN